MRKLFNIELIMNRGIILFIVFILVFGFVNTGCSEPYKSKPNILFILTDDQTYNGIHALNNPEVITPHMDALVEEGVTFTNAHILGASSGAVCAPSRAMIMTGRSFFNLPKSVCVPWSVPKEQNGDCPYITMPEVFRNAGYTTFGTGKQHNGTKIFHRGFTDGAKLFFSGMHNPKKGGHLKPLVNDFDPTGEYENPYVENIFSTDLYSDAAVEFIENYNEDAPFMIYVAYTAPHDPRMAPAKFVEMYPPEKISLPENFLPQHPFDNGQLKIRDEKLAPLPRTPERIKVEIGGYYAMITHLDQNIGRILDALEQKGLKDNTIIVFAGDNGLAVGQHGLLGKQNLYEHSTGVPLIFAGLGIPRGKRVDALVYLHDVFPTLCDLTGLKIPLSVESRSLKPLIEGSAEKVRDAQFYAYLNTMRAVRKGDWKLIRYNIKGKKHIQLFNLENDPWEINNLAEDKKYKAIIKELNDLMVKLGKENGDNEDWYYSL